MGKITFYCTICAGPLYECGLRKASTAQPGDDENSLFEDDCECSGQSDDEEDPLKHSRYCPYREGYWGDILSERDIAWLAGVRMLRMRGEYERNEDESELPHEDHGSCYLTPIGEYDSWFAFSLPGTNESLWPNQDGFVVHDACWQLLQLVHKATKPSQRPLDLRRIYLTMMARVKDCNDVYLEWRDPRLYGGTTEFTMQEWEALPGYEWLVADPLKDIDFLELVEKATLVESRSQNQNVARTSIPADPFAKLPIEVRYMILELLPSESVLNLFLSSHSFREASTCLPGAFWRSRIYTDTPWIEGTSLFETVSNLDEKVDYKTLLCLLKETSASLPGGRNSRYETNLSLKNRRRIWTCCEGILDILSRRTKESGSVSSELESITNSQVGRIRHTTGMENSTLIESETYFRPTILDPPLLSSLTVYFSKQMSIIGIEWHLEGEESGRLFGKRATGMQSIALPPDLLVTGIVLSLGPESLKDSDRMAYGLGILSMDSVDEPRIKLGRWTENDIVKVFRPAENQPAAAVVGITGQYSDIGITKLGILIANMDN
ncbi:uncharacterized protein APUU_70890A [Aspergillus puulaauensis]|uniref:F-box domain-containing protein n=1 Tax=Aspergillus puulaauensis TaxID=1220207 RepID=A0A7R8ATY6_9EURO|nr:uncharacterized protein APUU_70890A [Aspergillus puulaauensis]BCS29320.1 hypothetical protein APUU_70890A [Aspergillus puulaauensis]